jgi:hypothetical protein
MKLSPLDRIRESNRQALDAGERWASHREHVMAVLAGASDSDKSLCLLGAGHAHDVRLAELRRRYATVTVVDIDEDTIARALVRDALDPAEYRVVAPIDLTGILDAIANRADAGQLLRVLAADRCRIPGAPFDVTVSLGALTQLLQAVLDSDLDRHDVTRVSLAVRDKHLRDVVDLTKPGGTAILITDVVSSTTAPALRSTPPQNLEAEMARLVSAHNFFTGVNPYRLVALLEEDPRYRNRVSTVRIVGPWLWAVTADREHLTCAIVADRYPTDPSATAVRV